jgi:hypothetical protein
MSLPLIFSLSDFPGYVGKDYEELLAVVATLVVSMGLMVAFGAWWSR